MSLKIFFYELKMEKQTKQKQSKAKTTTKQTSKENQTLTSMILYISNDLTMRNLYKILFQIRNKIKWCTIYYHYLNNTIKGMPTISRIY